MSVEHNFGIPEPADAKYLRELKLTPLSKPDIPPKRCAVVLDCEMVGVHGGSSEAIRLSAVDYLSGDVLVDSLIKPDQRIVSWRTKYSGVSPPMLASACARGDILRGWKGAREELYKHIDSKTVLVGQSLQNDLRVLRMVHTRIIDSAILTKNLVEENCHRQWSLKTLCKELLNIEIQRGKFGHDSLEDAYASREIVISFIRQPGKFMAWGTTQRNILREQREEQRRKREEKEKSQNEKTQNESESTSVKSGEQKPSSEVDYESEEELVVVGGVVIV